MLDRTKSTHPRSFGFFQTNLLTNTHRVPTNRAAQVEKNMTFLSLRVLYGGIVESGHLSTDHDYRVQLVEVLHDEFRTLTIDNYLQGVDSRARILELLPFYRDAAEEWASFPPAPAGQTERRNKIMDAIFFPKTVSYEFDWSDASYVFHNMLHFSRLLMVSRGDQVAARLPAGLRPIFNTYTNLFSNVTDTRKLLSSDPMASVAVAGPGGMGFIPFAAPFAPLPNVLPKTTTKGGPTVKKAPRSATKKARKNKKDVVVLLQSPDPVPSSSSPLKAKQHGKDLAMLIRKERARTKP
jgi:hypothetical protein